MELTEELIRGLLETPGITIYGPKDPRRQVSTVSFTLRGISPSEASLRLDEEFGILCRVGLHCAPAAHRTIGTFPQGTIRWSLSYLNTREEVYEALKALHRMARGGA
jgi:selenocysteine lyase/cysteine desulfurase